MILGKKKRKKINNELILQTHLSNIKKLIKKEAWDAIRKYLKILSNEYNFKVTKYCLEHQYYNDLPDFNYFIFPILCKETKTDINKFYTGSESYQILSYNNTNLPILLSPWNKSRILSNLISINKNNVLSSKKGIHNIYNNYLFPLDLILCGGGNHSQLSALLENEGESFISMIFDFRPLYDKVKFDGNDFVSLERNEPIDVILSKTDIALEAKYLLGIYFEIGRLLINHKEYFPDYITKYLNEF